MVLTQRVLNRTTLERQLLLSRSSLSPLSAVERLVAVQGQEPNSPYYSLWTRLDSFTHDDLTSLMYGKRVVRASLIRGTQHLATADDYLWLRPMMQTRLRAARQSAFGKDTATVDLEELAELARKHLSGRTLTRPQLAALLAERWPDVEKMTLGWSAQMTLPLVHTPPNGTWNKGGATPFTLAEEWLERPLEWSAPVELLIERYLATYGPAGVMDIQMWSGLTRLREVVAGMDLRHYTDETGRDLVDLPSATLASGEEDAPVRFLPYFDNLVVAFADRSRLMTPEQRKQICVGSMVYPTFLVDGTVGGMWDLKDGTLVMQPFAPLRASAAADLAEEGARLLAFAGFEGGSITWQTPSGSSTT
ncbi:winged helix DNA-binding domain-containing protein [Nonomuraea sp. NPDC050556]|uniref:winged helix DNA-binding domain-containing protein n=1 Tax=Nonomuraea sp. NPDC050556 TaxID=3364369 RepID=UPI0037B3F469